MTTTTNPWNVLALEHEARARNSGDGWGSAATCWANAAEAYRAVGDHALVMTCDSRVKYCAAMFEQGCTSDNM